MIPQFRQAIFLLLFSTLIVGCKKEVVEVPADSNSYTGSDFESSVEDQLVNEDSDEMSAGDLEAEKELDRIEEQFEAEMTELDRLELVDTLETAVRKYKRQNELMAYHEKRYHEKLRVWFTNFVLLEMRATPGIFAGDVPEKDVYAFMELMDACEEVKEVVEMLEDYDNSKDNRLASWKALKTEVVGKLGLTFPSSGSPLQDALIEMRTESYRSTASRVIPLVVKLSVERKNEVLRDAGDLMKGTGGGAEAVQDIMKTFEEDSLKAMKELEKFLGK